MKIKEKIEQKQKEYQEKLQYLQQLQEAFEKTKREAINLEGQITALQEIDKEG